MSQKLLLRMADIKSSQDIPPDFLDRDCRSCLYWLDRKGNERTAMFPEAVKTDWFESTSSIIGSCGKVAYLGNQPVAWVHYGPSYSLPRAFTYHASPSNDSYLIACLVVAPGFRRYHIGEMVLKRVLEDIRSRGVRAVEVFARRGSADNPAGPIDLYLQTGFTVKDDDSMFPLLRYEFEENTRDTGMSYVISQTRYGLDRT